MKNIMTTVTLLTLLVSCQKSELEPRLSYELNTLQPNTVTIELVTVGGAKYDFQQMYEEVNADYFNRYGIAIEFEIKDSIPIPNQLIENPDSVYFPTGNENAITVFVVEPEYVRFNNAVAYALIYFNKSMIVIGENSVKSSTLAHEIGHVLGLDHMDIEGNVMHPFKGKRQYQYPNGFMAEQVDTMLIKIKDPFKGHIKAMGPLNCFTR